MANHSSAKKALRQTAKRTLINRMRVSRIKTKIKKLEAVIASGDVNAAKSSFPDVQSEIMRAVTKKVLKLNTASRKVKALANKIKNIA